jgi:membrane-associated phospholipid phosphatase
MRDKYGLFIALIICFPGWGQEFSSHFNSSGNKEYSNEFSDLLNTKIPFNTIGLSGDTLTSQRWYQSKAFRISVVPAALLTSSALTWGIRNDIREIRNRFIPTFDDHFDDLTQFVPGLSVYALNAAGIKGKHSVKRATVSMLIGGGISAVLVTALKYTTNVVRPDGSTNNSFPSGHTASAVVSATFLHKEYGQYRDPLYSVGGYAFAAATGIGRQLNNRHWISDVLAGAGIGLISTEIGYLIADKIYGDRGMNAP